MMTARNPATQGCARLWNFHFGGFGRTWEGIWSPRQESNLYLALRRHLFYPLNYGEIDLATVKVETFFNQSLNLVPWAFPAFSASS